MAQIHRISGCTQYLLDGIGTVNGKKPSNIEEINYFYKNYETILSETLESIAKEHDEKIAGLSEEESILTVRINEIRRKRTEETAAFIEELNEKSNNTENCIKRTGYRFQYWISLLFRNYRINRNSGKDDSGDNLSKKLRDVRSGKKQIIKSKANKLKTDCNNLNRTFDFLKDNQTFMIGADGEEKIIDILSQLPDEYHLINDVNLKFSRPIYWKKHKEYIKTCQIDHVVAGPTGLFLIETKNWKPSDIELKLRELKHQVERSGLGLWYYLRGYYPKRKIPTIRKVVVSINGHSGKKPYKYIDIVAPYQLCRYITERERKLSDDDIAKIVKLIP